MGRLGGAGYLHDYPKCQKSPLSFVQIDELATEEKSYGSRIKRLGRNGYRVSATVATVILYYFP